MKRFIIYLLGCLIQFASCENTIYDFIKKNAVIYGDANLLVELFYYNGHQVLISLNGNVRFNLIDKSKNYRKNYLFQVGLCYDYDINWWIGNVQLTNVFFNVAWVKLLNTRNPVDMKKYLDFSVFFGFFTYWFIFGVYFVNWSKYQKDFGLKVNLRIFNFKIFNFSAGGVVAYKNYSKSYMSQINLNNSNEDIDITSDDFEIGRFDPFLTKQEHKIKSDETNRCIGYCDNLSFITILDEDAQVMKDYYEKYPTFEDRRNNLEKYFSDYAGDLLMLAFYYRDCESQKDKIENQKKIIKKKIEDGLYKFDERFPMIDVVKNIIFKDEYKISECEEKISLLKENYDLYKNEHPNNSENIKILTYLNKILSGSKKLNIVKLNDKYNEKLVEIFENMECLESENIDDILKYLNYDYEQDIKKDTKKKALEEDADSSVHSLSTTFSDDDMDTMIDEDDNNISRKSKEDIEKEKTEDKKKLLICLNKALFEEQNIKEKIERMKKEVELWEFVKYCHIKIFKKYKNFDAEAFKELKEQNDKTIEEYTKEIEKEKNKKQKTNIFDVI